MARGKNRHKHSRKPTVSRLDRQSYFDKNIKPQRTAEKYVMALRMSPFKTHRRAAQVLQGELKVMKTEHEEILKEYAYDSSEDNPTGGTNDSGDTGS